MTVQYQESDLAFLKRLLAEEGLFCWFAHQAEALGRHTQVIADHNGAFAANPQARFRFTQSGATGQDCSYETGRSWRIAPDPNRTHQGSSGARDARGNLALPSEWTSLPGGKENAHRLTGDNKPMDMAYLEMLFEKYSNEEKAKG